MKFLDIHKNKAHYSNQNTPQLTFESIQMISTDKGLHLTIETSFLKRNNYKIDIKEKMLYVGMMISKITSNKKYTFKKYFKYAFIEGHITLPHRRQLQIDAIKYSNGLLRIQLVEKSKRYNKDIKNKPFKTYNYLQNSKEVLQLTP